MREPLLLPLGTLVAGIAASQIAGIELVESAAAGCALLLLAGLASWQGHRRIAVTCVLVMLAFGGAIVDRLHRPGPPPVIDSGPRENVVIEGCVVEAPVVMAGRQSFVAELDHEARARVNVYFDEDEAPLDLPYGARIDITGRIRPPRNFRNPGSFDYEHYLARRNIFWNINVSSPADVTLLPGRCGSHFQAVIHGIRAAALERIEKMYAGHRRRQAMLRAVLLGEESQIEELWKDSFQRTGTYHTLVISGLHLAVLATFLYWLFRLAALPLGWRIALTTLTAWFYALVTGSNTPVIRAAAGLTLFLIASWFFRRRRLLNILAAIAIGFLLVDPGQLFEASFHLSFLAVAMIGAFAIPMLEGLPFRDMRAVRGLRNVDRDLHLPPSSAQLRIELRLLAETAALWLRLPEKWILTVIAGVWWVLHRLAELAVVSAVIQVGLALPMAVYFHRVSFTGLLANPVVVPLMSLAVPAGFAGIVTGWAPVAAVAGWLVDLSLWVVLGMAQWEASLRLPAPPGWLGGLFLSSLVVAAACVRAGGRWRLVAPVLPSAALAAILIHPFPPDLPAGSLELSAIDVGQAESLFVAFPDGETMVVDGGGLPYGGERETAFDPGEDVVSPYLWSRSIRRLDVVVSSHGHEDHIGGLFAVIDNFRPREVWTGTAANDLSTEALRARARETGAVVRILAAGDRFEFGPAIVEVLAPATGERLSTTASNNDSLVLRLSHGRHSFLLTGDIDKTVEATLMPTLKRVDVLKVAHHGSRTSTTPLFLSSANPAFALVSAGWANAFGFPHPEVLDGLAGIHSTVLATNKDGLVTVRSDGFRFETWTYRWNAATRSRIDGPSW